MLSDIVVQKSIREGFGLVVSEALWEGTPVVAGRAGGIPRLVLNDLRLMRALLDDLPIVRTPDWQAHRDPACGMVLEGAPRLTLAEADRTWEFCSKRCRAAFVDDPETCRGQARTRG